MTIRNITAGFKVSGIYPFDRNVVLDKLPDEKFTSFKPESVQQSSGLAYIPLYSPAPKHKARKVHESNLSDTNNLVRSSESKHSEASESDIDLDACYITSQ